MRRIKMFASAGRSLETLEKEVNEWLIENVRRIVIDNVLQSQSEASPSNSPRITITFCYHHADPSSNAAPIA